MRSRLIAVATAFLAIALLGAGSAACAATGYDELLAQAKHDNPAVDFKALRYAYAESEYYNPYDAKESELRASLLKAFADKDCVGAIIHAQAILERNYVYIDAHVVLNVCYGRLNRPQQAKHHALMAHGLLASITATGDGKTPKTAFVVISVAEEYSVIGMLGLKKVRQALVQAEGHRYDQINVENKSGGADKLYFNIDRLYAWWKRNNKAR